MPFIRFNLQFFQGEKTEQATPKKRKDARDKGQVVQSRDINTAVILLAVFLTMNAFKSYFVDEFFAMFQEVFSYFEAPRIELEINDVIHLAMLLMVSFAKMTLPLLAVAMLTGTVLSYMQVGFLFTVEPLKPQLNKLNPLSGLKRMFSMKSTVEMIKSIFKSVGILVLSYFYIMDRMDYLMHSMTFELPQGIAVMWDVTMGIIIRCGLFLLIVSIFDFAYKKWENEKELRMSKQEIKDEFKQMEGDPLVKSKIKEKQRQMAMSRMMQEVPKADVIITNPSHYAVALLYNRKEAVAPKVVAKGRDLIAQNIKKIAAEHNVPIVENKPLARALYAAVDIDDYIPAEMFEAVADVLAYVYQLNGRRVE